MPLGRPRRPGTDAERAAARRQQVRENVRAFRQRNRERAQLDNQPESSDSEALSRQSSVARSEAGSSSQVVASSSEALSTSFRRLSTSSQAAGLGSTASTIPTSSVERNISVTSETIGRTIKWSLGLPFRIDLGPAYSGAFIAAFQYRSLPAPTLTVESDSIETESLMTLSTEPQDTITDIAPTEQQPTDEASNELTRVEICYHTWTTSVSFEAMSPGSEMLREALLSAALNLISIERNDRAMAMQAVQIQATALRKLRDGFDDYLENKDPAKATLLSATALACSMSELLVNKSWDGFSLHLKGVGALIEHAGPDALDDQIARDHFYGYRAVQFPFSFLHRRGSFLAREEWINLEWRGGDLGNCPIHTLLDIGLQVPSEMEHYDKNPNRRPGALRRQLKKLNDLASELNQWKVDVFSRYTSAMYTAEPASWTGLHSEAIHFTNDIVASSFTVYTGIRVALFSLVRQLAEDLKAEDESAIPVLTYSIEESFKWSRIACQCTEYFFAREPNVAGKVLCLFPFDTAWSTFVELGENYDRDMTNELRWCQGAAERIEATGLPVFKVRSRI
ncbi:uncharacterized protein LY89DRAFT_676194 [Mollisia scopiformis]|uniref:Uncharacterized protein n=1 Tax=Mollisia scopiformis TaxID=149040 RepID=A0A132BAF5_MOLSC|nr:uncharacterized protein LY89DRAFT_676194 [Mollisia scopiformis]KUJ09400.1 hypothetical protein LY89DRAFT_676194 [Mollisia scopiformis]